MIGVLLGIPGKLKTLTDRLTSARAGYLDNLNTNLAVLPAPASTALSTATWTGTKAGYLDAAISSVATSSIVSVQTGWVNAARTGASAGTEDASYWEVTISTVVVAKCLALVIDGYDSDVPGTRVMTARVTSTTNLRASSAVSVGSNVHKFRWYVIEFR
jgi:hypothetical protein